MPVGAVVAFGAPMASARAFLPLVLLAAPLLACGGGALDGGGGAAGSEAAGGESGTSGQPASGGTGGAGSGGGVPAVEDPFEPPPLPLAFTDEQLADLRADIDEALGTASASYSALIVGLDSGQVVYEKNADVLRKPASNTKLFTTAASLVAVGEAGRPKLGAYGTVAGGAVQGDLVLVGQHDPSPTPWFGDGSRQALDAIAESLRDEGVDQITGGVIAKGEFLYEGDSLGTIDFPSERAQVASAFRQALVAAGISVAGGASTATGFDPPSGSELLVAAPSASADVVAHAINVPSHNEMADLSLHHLGFLQTGESTYAAGFSSIEGVLDDLGVAHGGLELHDGSGLSHSNRATPRQIVDLFQAMSERSEWSAFVSSMAISGLRGTIASRMGGPDTAGRFWGKTGTLTGVIALSGVLFHRHDGQRYLASFLANDVASSNAVRAALDTAVLALAADRKGTSGVPDAPRLDRVTDDGNGQTAVVQLAPVDAATGYLVWRSRDGRNWQREDARFVHTTSHRTFTFEGELFVRVSAVGPAGESVPSNVLAVRTSSSGVRSLLVDGNDRYAAAPLAENPLGWGHDALVAHAAAVAGPFESASHIEVESGAVDLSAYDAVLWALGRESSANETFSAAEQERVRAYVEGGGRLFVSGAELGYDLVAEGTADDASFARDVLGFDYLADDAATTFVAPGEVALGTGLARFSKLGRHEAAYPDVIAPSSGGATCLRYAGSGGGAACVVTDTPGGGRVVALGFPLESLDDPGVGAKLGALLAP